MSSNGEEHIDDQRRIAGFDIKHSLRRSLTASTACESGDEHEEPTLDSPNNDVWGQGVPSQPLSPPPPPGLNSSVKPRLLPQSASKPEETSEPISEFECLAKVKCGANASIELTKTKTAAPGKGTKGEENQGPVTTVKPETITFENWQKLEKYFNRESIDDSGTETWRYVCKSGARHCKFGGCAAKHRCKWLVAQQRKANGQVPDETEMEKCGWCHEEACLNMLPDRLWPQQRRRRDKQQKQSEAQEKEQEDKTLVRHISCVQSFGAPARREEICICGHIFESHAKFCLECGRPRAAKGFKPPAQYNRGYPTPSSVGMMTPAMHWWSDRTMQWQSPQEPMYIELPS